MLDNFDRKILAILQTDATISLSDLAELVNLSITPCWRRLKRLEKDGIIQRRVALLDAAKLNLGMIVFVQIKASQHSHKWVERFTALVHKVPEIVEVQRMGGNIDYQLKVLVPSLSIYNSIYQRLTRELDIHEIVSNVAMEQIKFTTAVPLDHAP